MIKREMAIQMLQRAELLVTPEEVDRAYDRLASWIGRRHWNSPVMLAVLNGGLRIAGELMARLDIPMQLETVRVARYGQGTIGQQYLAWIASPVLPLAGQDLLLLDDVLDEGETLHGIQQALLSRNINSLATLVLVRKDIGRPVKADVDLAGLTLPNRFLVGEGMDIAGFGRNLRGIWALLPEDEDRCA